MTGKNVKKSKLAKKFREIDVYELRNGLFRKKLEFVNFHEIFKNEIFSSFSIFFREKLAELEKFYVKSNHKLSRISAISQKFL